MFLLLEQPTCAACYMHCELRKCWWVYVLQEIWWEHNEREGSSIAQLARAYDCMTPVGLHYANELVAAIVRSTVRPCLEELFCCFPFLLQLSLTWSCAVVMAHALPVGTSCAGLQVTESIHLMSSAETLTGSPCGPQPC